MGILDLREMEHGVRKDGKESERRTCDDLLTKSSISRRECIIERAIIGPMPEKASVKKKPMR